MSNINKKATDRINNFCVTILDQMGYEIDEESRCQKLRSHCGLIITSLAMLLLSVVSLLNGVGWLVFLFHAASIFYKLVVLQFQKRIGAAEVEKEKNGTAVKSLSTKVISPYHTQFVMLMVILVVLVIVIAVTFIYKESSALSFAIVAVISLAVTFCKEILDGLVSLYNARGIGHCIQRKK